MNALRGKGRGGRGRGFKLEGHPSYVEYCAGVDGTGKRWEKLPVWDKNSDGEYHIPLGDVFCRVKDDDVGGICAVHPDASSSHSNNKKRVKKHEGVEVAAIHGGAPTKEAVVKAKRFYDRVMEYIHDTDEQLIYPDAPVTGAPQVISSDDDDDDILAPSFDDILSSNIVFPMTKKNTPNQVEMRRLAGVRGTKCAHCKFQDRKCPGPEEEWQFDMCCAVWSYWRGKAMQIKTGNVPAESDDKDDSDSDSPF